MDEAHGVGGGWWVVVGGVVVVVVVGVGVSGVSQTINKSIKSTDEWTLARQGSAAESLC